MIVVGTTVNILAGLFGLILFAHEAPTAVGAAVYFAPLPYNVFLLAALWKTAAGAEAGAASLARLVGGAWFAVMLIV